MSPATRTGMFCSVRHGSVPDIGLAGHMPRTIAMLISLLLCTAAAAAGAENELRRFDLAIVEGRADSESDTIRVAEGDSVEIHWRSDAPIDLHLHGYDIEANVTPRSPAVMRFEARISGRFKVERHDAGGHHHGAVLYIELYPK